MHQDFDVTLKELFEDYMADYLDPLQRRLGLRLGGTVRVIDADLSTVTARADKVFLVEGPPRLLLDLEPQSGPDLQLPARALKYSVLLTDRHQLQVKSVVLLLRPKADGRHLTGTLRYQIDDEEDSYLVFRYHVWRVWREPVETFLTGGLGLLPLAPIARVPRRQLPGVIARMDERIEREAAPAAGAKLRASAKLLMGLRCRREEAELLMPGGRWMKDSDTYLEILEEGELKEARKFFLRLACKRLGAPDESQRVAVEGIADRERLEQLGERLLDVSSWQELLAAARPRRRNRS